MLRFIKSLAIWFRTNRLGVTISTLLALSIEAVIINTADFPEPVGITTIAGSFLNVKWEAIA